MENTYASDPPILSGVVLWQRLGVGSCSVKYFASTHQHTNHAYYTALHAKLISVETGDNAKRPRIRSDRFASCFICNSCQCGSGRSRAAPTRASPIISNSSKTGKGGTAVALQCSASLEGRTETVHLAECLAVADVSIRIVGLVVDQTIVGDLDPDFLGGDERPPRPPLELRLSRSAVRVVATGLRLPRNCPIGVRVMCPCWP